MRKQDAMDRGPCQILLKSEDQWPKHVERVKKLSAIDTETENGLLRTMSTWGSNEIGSMFGGIGFIVSTRCSTKSFGMTVAVKV